jgi:hypothetical protein
VEENMKIRKGISSKGFISNIGIIIRHYQKLFELYKRRIEMTN